MLKAKVERAIADGKIMAYEELTGAEGKLASAKAIKRSPISKSASVGGGKSK